MKITDVQKQRFEWRKKGWSIPELRGGKQEWFNIVVELIQKIGEGSIADINLCPELKSSSSADYSWRTYTPFLKGVGLLSNRSGFLGLSDNGNFWQIQQSGGWHVFCMTNIDLWEKCWNY